MSTLYAGICRKRVEAWANPWAVEYVGPAFSGDVEAAGSLMVALSNELRGDALVAMWQAKIPRAAYREALIGGWTHDHRGVIAAAGTRRRAASMFAYARFPLPDHWPVAVRLWRGTSALTLAQAREGFSWTLSRDTACWFAMRFATPNLAPLVLTAEVPKSDIAMHDDGRGEDEAVLTRRPPLVTIDGNPDEWADAFQRVERANRAADTERWASMKATR